MSVCVCACGCARGCRHENPLTLHSFCKNTHVSLANQERKLGVSKIPHAHRAYVHTQHLFARRQGMQIKKEFTFREGGKLELTLTYTLEPAKCNNTIVTGKFKCVTRPRAS